MKDWMDKKELAIYVKRSPRTVDRWINKGILPPPNKAAGRSAIWSKTSVDRWIDNGYTDKVEKLRKSLAK